MLKESICRWALLGVLLPGALVGFAGCVSKGPAQQAGESIDRGVQNAKDAIIPPGPGEKVGRGVDRALGK
ncbi:MAG: hypothetical protein NVSMB9_25720 [Isosphaeraceae bacterium]